MDERFFLYFEADSGWYYFREYDTLDEAVRQGEQSMDVPFRIEKWVNQGCVWEERYD